MRTKTRFDLYQTPHHLTSYLDANCFWIV